MKRYEIIASGTMQCRYYVLADNPEQAKEKFEDDEDVAFLEELDGSFTRGDVLSLEEDEDWEDEEEEDV